jgi:uncharacterized protein YggE
MNAYKSGIWSVILAGALAGAAWAEDCSKVSVTGTATRQLKPDVAYVTVFINGDGILMSDAAKKADENGESVIKAVKEGRTNIIDITVKTVDVGEKSSRTWSADQQSAPPKPQVTRQIRITIPPEPALAYEIIDAAIRSGAILTRDSMTHYSSEVRGVVVYGVQGGEAIEEELKKDALEDARKQAEKTSRWAEKSVGPVCSIGCQSITTWPQSMVLGGKTMDYPTKYLGTDPEQIEIKTTMSATFELQEK